MELPAISVIIPLYNAERFIGELLDSILAQTFKNFEVIVVDDCSTDNSVAVVESYRERFGGRLKLVHTEKNSGAPGVPSNIGLSFSRGEYLSILDDDDIITPTAFEELYPIAKAFDADVVACEIYFNVPAEHWHDPAAWQAFHEGKKPDGNFVDKPTLITADIAERVNMVARRENVLPWPMWAKLIRRDFLLENDIRFADNVLQDVIAAQCMIYVAKNYVRVPNVVNCYRNHTTSLSNRKEDTLKYIRKYLRVLTNGFKHMDDFFERQGIFPTPTRFEVQRTGKLFQRNNRLSPKNLQLHSLL
ncbi:MAG: glycosyltransferase [Quinella sp. 1Q7]|nr:glycosyltransferase [Quinella sp. 1Q7]